MNTTLKPTESELEILQILWQKEGSTVREVNDILNQTKDVGYTTTLKLMQIMNEKGILSRDEENRTHIYHAQITESETQKMLLNKFVDSTFRGSAMKLVMQALGNHDATKEELDNLKKLIQNIENNGQ
ncbi:MAG: BlaI/MecI/CopY family transcriptional regulator [Bacteroidota bacterium]